jgi:hypothetical protein
MNSKTTQVFNGWLSLSEHERTEFRDAVQRFQSGAPEVRRHITEDSRSAINKMQTGPLGGTCACCGR